MTDKRYSTARWRRVRALVLSAALHRCWRRECDEPANTADHINPVYGGMPDAEFFDRTNLRASCRWHNIERGHMAAVGRGDAPVRRARSYGHGRFLSGSAKQERTFGSRYTQGDNPPLTGDFSRKAAG